MLLFSFFSESGEPCILVRCVLRLLCNPALLSLLAQHIALLVFAGAADQSQPVFIRTAVRTLELNTPLLAFSRHLHILQFLRLSDISLM
jgi:hypothetical protein